MCFTGLCSRGVALTCALRSNTCVRSEAHVADGADEKGKAGKRGASRVAQVPAEVTLREGGGALVADSQGHAVHVGARLGTETGVEVIGHAVRTGHAAGETEERMERSGGN